MITTKIYQDASFEAGDSPVTHDVATDLGKYASRGSIINSGANLTCEIMQNEGDWGTPFTIFSGESLDLSQFEIINQIKLTHVGDTSYRIIATI